MALNVKYDGKHIGFVARSFPDHQHLFMVALTKLHVEDVSIDVEGMKSYLGKELRFKNFFGKISEEELENFLEEKRVGKYQNSGITNIDDFLRFFFLKVADERGFEIEKLFDWEELNDHINGYLLLKFSDVEISENAIIIKNNIDYISEAALSGVEKPIYTTVVGYPIFRTDIMGGAEGFFLGANLSDFGGRNHTHETELNLQSGNYEQRFIFPIQMYVKKDMPLQLYFDENRIKRIFCGEAIYEFEF